MEKINKAFYNTKCIESIYIRHAIVNDDYYWCKGYKKTFWLPGKEAGFYMRYSYGKKLDLDNLPADLFYHKESNQIWVKDRVVICYVSGSCEKYYFNSYEEATQFSKEIIDESDDKFLEMSKYK